MPHIHFAVKPDSIGVGRTARNVSYKTDTRADWCGEVDEVLPGETEITGEQFASIRADNAAHNAALPPPAPASPPPMAVPTASDVVAFTVPPALSSLKTILSKADADITVAEVKTVVLIMARYLLKKFVGGWR